MQHGKSPPAQAQNPAVAEQQNEAHKQNKATIIQLHHSLRATN